MAKKKTEEIEIRHAGDPNVMGLRGAVVEPPNTATQDAHYLPYAMSVDDSRANPHTGAAMGLKRSVVGEFARRFADRARSS